MDEELKGIENLISAIEESITPMIDSRIKQIASIISDIHVGNLFFMNDVLSLLESKNIIDGDDINSYILASYNKLNEKGEYSANVLMAYRHFLMLKGVIPMPGTGDGNEKQ